MTESSLQNRIDVEDEHVFWTDEHGNPVGPRQFKIFRSSNNAVFERAVDNNVAILLNSRSTIAQLMYGLDGVCAKLFVVPADVHPGNLVALLEQAEINLLITNRELDVMIPGIEVYRIQQDPRQINIQENVNEFPANNTTEWLIATSGTTGIPKLLVHSIAELTGSVKQDSGRGAEFTWGLLYDLSRYAGLQVYFQSLIGGSRLVIPAADVSLNEQIELLSTHGCNALSATPTLWRKILMSPDSGNLKLRQITLGGEIVDQRILDALAKQYPKAKIIHIYASTEAGVGFSVMDKLAGFPENYLVNPPAKVDLKVEDNRLFIKSDRTASRYLGAATLKDDQNFVDTGDVVHYSNGRYYFAGRESGLINVGGNKVFPEEIEQVVLSYALARLAYVYARSSPLMGNLVACDVVLDNASGKSLPELKKELRQFCSARLPDWKVPALFRVVDNIDVTLSGKQARK